LPRTELVGPAEKKLPSYRFIGTALLMVSFLVGTAYLVPAATAREADMPFRSIVPNGWTLLPPEPQSYGHRFVSPTGDAWLWFFAVPANREAAVSANTDRVAPAQTERVTYEARGRNWLVSSGYKGDRIFYRKAILACKGTKWRHIEFEYPASEKRLFDNFVTRTSFALRAYQDIGCGQ
jgi:serine/threonine-protein kinase